MRTIKEDFKRLLENNKDKDWNDLTFRQTMADAFRFNINKRVEWLKEEINKQTGIGTTNQGIVFKELIDLIDQAFPDLQPK